MAPVCREEEEDKDQGLLRKALQDKASLQTQVQQLRGQVSPITYTPQPQ